MTTTKRLMVRNDASANVGDRVAVIWTGVREFGHKYATCDVAQANDRVNSGNRNEWIECYGHVIGIAPKQDGHFAGAHCYVLPE